MREAFRVFRISRNCQPATLFHGVDGSRELKVDVTLKAKRRWVYNPGKKGKGRRFLSGWHVVLDPFELASYLKRFKHPEELVVCRVLVSGLRPKPGSKVHLADRMKVTKEDWANAVSAWVRKTLIPKRSQFSSTYN